MDALKQTKLEKSEWDSMEIPVANAEKDILEIIRKGYHDIHIRENHTINLQRFTKMEMKPEFEQHMYTKYFHPTVKDIITKYCKDNAEMQAFTSGATKIKRLKSADTIRIQNADSTIQYNSAAILEFEMLEYCKKICRGIRRNLNNYFAELYTLIHCYQVCTAKNTTIPFTNSHVLQFVAIVIAHAKREVTVENMISYSVSALEQNPYISKYQDISLYPHQKQLFRLCHTEQEQPKLILYIAPTGTGKTLSPIGLSESSRVLFVCVGRHVGLALAKSAISVRKRVAFAFGCSSAADIRLHYFAAADYQTNRRTGRITKVDNTNGSKVEIMICDVQSYLYAMYYMLSFNEANDVITYWDEPTMTLDYAEHELHEQISKNWRENQVPNVILSCATLPTENEIPEVITNFQSRFPGAIVQTITSYDYVKTIPIVNSKGFAFLPHLHYEDPDKVRAVADYCNKNKTLLRYFDVDGIVQFIKLVHFLQYKKTGQTMMDERYTMDEYFDDITDIHMSSLKEYYLVLLQNINYNHWSTLHQCTVKMTKPKIDTGDFSTSNVGALRRTQSVYPEQLSSKEETPLRRNASEPNQLSSNLSEQDPLKGVRLTTKDAHTLTSGPTIYLADNLMNLAKLYVHQSSIPQVVLNHILDSIQYNQKLRETIEQMEEELEKKTQVRDNSDSSAREAIGSGKSNSSRKVKEKDVKDESSEALEANLKQLRRQIRYLSLQPEYLPNSAAHQEKWVPDYGSDSSESKHRPYMSNIDQDTVKEIMNLNIEQPYKVLVLMGIGVLMNHTDHEYEVIVKRLAQEQKLYLILTSTDYIYGTNYQFCHGFIGKDLQNMTQQKIIQCMGRIGRNKIQHSYTVRFRNDSIIEKVFMQPEENMEAINMSRLFS
jgi:hypothetical protein